MDSQFQGGISINNLTKRYGAFVALNEIDFEARPGQISAVVGPNGAGKSTLLKCIIGLVKIDTGNIVVQGLNVSTDANEVRKHIGLISEDQGLYSHMTTRNYLTFFANLYGLRVLSAESIEFAELLGLTAYWNKTLGTLSKGNRQKVLLVRCIIHHPPILLLDEPTDNLDPESREGFFEFISNQRELQRTVLLCTHNLEEIERIADRVTLLRDGKAIHTQELGVPLDDPTEVTFTLDKCSRDILEQFPEVNTIRVIDQGERISVRVLVSSPESVPECVSRLVRLGIRVHSVVPSRSSLRRIYFKKNDNEEGI
ncbi:MAG: ABC transporter ATP-binding protein [Sulfobacillus thermotolerans]|nr:ABC transporter ATP-binding protein [Sulfobacillus thermotolerans]